MFVERCGVCMEWCGGVHVDTCSCGNQIETMLWSPAHAEASWPALPFELDAGGRQGEEWAPDGCSCDDDDPVCSDTAVGDASGS